MTTVKLSTGLTTKGKRKLLELLAEHSNVRSLDHLLSAWIDDVAYNRHGEGVASIEIGGYYTATGNPVTYDFSDDEVMLEDFETEDE